MTLFRAPRVTMPRLGMARGASEAAFCGLVVAPRRGDSCWARLTARRAEQRVWLRGAVRAFEGSPESARDIVREVRRVIPAAENPDRTKVPVTFWTYSPHGPRSVIRSLDAPGWQEITPNYAQRTLGHLGKLFAPEFQPGHGGQFVLWHGEPGTGKTTALRALAREWREWCSFHYIADPDNFFGSHADYMLDVLIREEYAELAAPGEQPPTAADDKWRVLILEDTGELLYADAREKVGQALSRFLNCVDGMIGQGLRVLTLVTTNEPLGKLHPAVTRPGRSALVVEFDALPEDESAVWLESHGLPEGDPSRRILADLYAELDGFEQRTKAASVGFGGFA
jgi:hypothetical protein